MPYICKQTGYAFYTAFDCAKFLMMCSPQSDHRLLDDYTRAVKNSETVFGYSFEQITKKDYSSYKPSEYSCCVKAVKGK